MEPNKRGALILFGIWLAAMVAWATLSDAGVL